MPYKVVRERAAQRCNIARAEFAARVASIDPFSIAWIDEMGKGRHNRCRAYRPRGVKGDAEALPRHFGGDKRYTVIGLVDMAGGFHEDACETVVHGAATDPVATTVDGSLFLSCLTRLVIPWLRNNTHIKYVVMDNAPVHPKEACEDALLAVDVQVLWLPPYSPDYNPIEGCFGLYKARHRRSFSGRLSEAEWCNAHVACLRVVTPANMRGFVRNAGVYKISEGPHTPALAEAAAAYSSSALLCALALDDDFSGKLLKDLLQ